MWELAYKSGVEKGELNLDDNHEFRVRVMSHVLYVAPLPDDVGAGESQPNWNPCLRFCPVTLPKFVPYADIASFCKVSSCVLRSRTCGPQTQHIHDEEGTHTQIR